MDDREEAVNELTIDDKGVLFFGKYPVGQIDTEVLVLNLGWMRMAGLGVRVQGDPDVDRNRSGVVFTR